MMFKTHVHPIRSRHEEGKAMLLVIDKNITHCLFGGILKVQK